MTEPRRWNVWVSSVAGAVLLLAAASPAAGQTRSPPRLEVFGGYSFLGATPSDFPRGASHGVEGEVAFHVNRWLGLMFSTAVQFNTEYDLGPNFPGVVAHSSVTEYLGGPRFVFRGDRADFFGQALVGIGSGRTDLAGFSDSSFVLGGGGGVDVRINSRLAVRGHLDVVMGFVDLMETDVRIGVGLVVRLR